MLNTHNLVKHCENIYNSPTLSKDSKEMLVSKIIAKTINNIFENFDKKTNSECIIFLRELIKYDLSRREVFYLEKIKFHLAAISRYSDGYFFLLSLFLVYIYDYCKGLNEEDKNKIKKLLQLDDNNQELPYKTLLLYLSNRIDFKYINIIKQAFANGTISWENNRKFLVCYTPSFDKKLVYEFIICFYILNNNGYDEIKELTHNSMYKEDIDTVLSQFKGEQFKKLAERMKEIFDFYTFDFDFNDAVYVCEYNLINSSTDKVNEPIDDNELKTQLQNEINNINEKLSNIGLNKHLDEHIQVYHLIEYISQIEVFQLNANIKCSSLVEYIFNYHGREVDNEEICEDEKFSTNISFYKYKSKFKGTKFMYDEYIKHYNDSFKGAKFIIYDNSKSYLHLSLDSFEINDLENSEIEKLVDEYKDFTGNYYYNTKYYYKEDIFKEFKQKYKRFTLVILTKYNINDNVIILDKPTYNSKTS